MEIKVCKNGEMVRDVIECNTSGGVVINYICVYMIKWGGLMSRSKSGGFVYKRYAAETQNTVNIISNACVNLVLQKI